MKWNIKKSKRFLKEHDSSREVYYFYLLGLLKIKSNSWIIINKSYLKQKRSNGVIIVKKRRSIIVVGTRRIAQLIVKVLIGQHIVEFVVGNDKQYGTKDFVNTIYIQYVYSVNIYMHKVYCIWYRIWVFYLMQHLFVCKYTVYTWRIYQICSTICGYIEYVYLRIICI